MFQRRRFKIRRSGNSAIASGSRGSGSHYDPENSNHHHHYYGGVSGGGGPLANFDACVEACDALAASSGKFGGGGIPLQQLQQQQNGDANINADGDGDANATLSSDSGPEYKGKSIMISPDGELLSSCHPTRSSSSMIASIVDSIVADAEKNNQNSQTTTDNQSTNTTAASEKEDVKTSHNSTINENYGTALPPPSSVRDHEIESSIYIGNDVMPDGEKALNGFSARGWNPIMTTMAIRRSVDTLQ